MPDLVFVDSNILVYAHDRSDPVKHAKAREVVRRCWTEHTGCVSLQVLQEFYVTITRKVERPLPFNAARELVATYSVWRLALLTPEDVIAASHVEERYDLQFWDALIVAGARRLNAPKIVSEDMQHGMRIDGTVIQNPFL